VPGIRVRGSSALGRADYAMLLNENPLPLENGSVHLDKRYCAAPPVQLQAMGIPKDDFVEAANPLTGAPGCWVAREHWNKLAQAGFDLWTEPLVFVNYHLEAMLRRNLSDSLDVDEVEALLEEWQKTVRGKELIEVVLVDSSARLHFARLLRALTRQRVPIVQGEEILGAIQDIRLSADTLPIILRAVRLRLRALLPGNSAEVRRAWLPQEWEDRGASWLRREGAETKFAAPPDQLHEFLLSIRSLITSELSDPTVTDLALVMCNWELTPYVRRLIEFEFPNLMVLSQEELLEASTPVAPVS
jgi:flagellar biosynthesis component FlhA